MIFKMYAIRDKLVRMVAEEKLSENSKVFQYYYKRINALLSLAPNIGLDDLISKLLSEKNSDARKNSLEKGQLEADEITKLKEFECDDVRQLVSEYYMISRDLILAHSSLSRLVLITVLKSNFLTSLVKKTLPPNWLFTLKVVDFMDKESTNLKRHA